MALLCDVLCQRHLLWSCPRPANAALRLSIQRRADIRDTRPGDQTRPTTFTQILKHAASSRKRLPSDVRYAGPAIRLAGPFLFAPALPVFAWRKGDS